VDEIWEWAELQKLNQQEQIAFLKSKNIDVFIHVFPRKEIAKLAKKAKITAPHWHLSPPSFICSPAITDRVSRVRTLTCMKRNLIPNYFHP
jgi:hypothetical protein